VPRGVYGTQVGRGGGGGGGHGGGGHGGRGGGGHGGHGHGGYGHGWGGWGGGWGGPWGWGGWGWPYGQYDWPTISLPIESGDDDAEFPHWGSRRFFAHRHRRRVHYLLGAEID